MGSHGKSSNGLPAQSGAEGSASRVLTKNPAVFTVVLVARYVVSRLNGTRGQDLEEERSHTHVFHDVTLEPMAHEKTVITTFSISSLNQSFNFRKTHYSKKLILLDSIYARFHN